MPFETIVQYGIATFALAGVFYLGYQLIGKFKPEKEESQTLKTSLENNTKALNNNTAAVAALSTFIQVDMAKLGVKIDEILSRLKERD